MNSFCQNVSVTIKTVFYFMFIHFSLMYRCLTKNIKLENITHTFGTRKKQSFLMFCMFFFLSGLILYSAGKKKK